MAEALALVRLPARSPLAYAAVFIVMTAVWCALGGKLVDDPLAPLQHYGRFILPVAVIALGSSCSWMLPSARPCRPAQPISNPGKK